MVKITSPRKISLGFNEPLTIAMILWSHQQGFFNRIPYHSRTGGYHGN
jgi:hypothetical protein